MSVVLHFLAGAHKNELLELDEAQELSFGRDPTCDVMLSEDNASRRHAKLQWDGQQLVLSDWHSSNGVYLNGEQIAESATLKDGDLAALGRTVFRVRLNSTAPPPGSSSFSAIPLPQLADHSEYAILFECLVSIQRILGSDERVVERSMETLFRVLPASRLSIIWVRDDGSLEQGYTVTPKGPTKAYIGRSFARRVFQANEAVLMRDAANLDSEAWGRTINEQSVKSILGVPICRKRSPVAILLCDNQHQPDALNETHVRLMEFVCRALEGVFQRHRLLELERKQIQTEREFLTAKRVQAQIFNKDPESIPGPMRWLVYHQPALEVGGDFWDFCEEEHGSFWIIADVCGKGVAAALVVSMLKAFCKSLYLERLAPAQFIGRLNDLLLHELPRGMFVTIAVMRLEGQRLTYASAGHPSGVLLRQRTGEAKIELLKSCDGVLGIGETEHILDGVVDSTVDLQIGDRLCFYTDGVIEASDDDLQQYGEERLLAQLAGAHAAALEIGLESLVQEITVFEGAGRQFDDITVLVGELQSAVQSETRRIGRTESDAKRSRNQRRGDSTETDIRIA